MPRVRLRAVHHMTLALALRYWREATLDLVKLAMASCDVTRLCYVLIDYTGKA